MGRFFIGLFAIADVDDTLGLGLEEGDADALPPPLATEPTADSIEWRLSFKFGMADEEEAVIAAMLARAESGHDMIDIYGGGRRMTANKIRAY